MKNKLFIIGFLFLCAFPLLGQDVKILSSGASEITFEYIPSFTDSAVVKINGAEYLNIQIANGVYLNYGKIGTPNILYREIPVGVPSENGNTIQVLSSRYETVSGKILPIPGEKSDGGSGMIVKYFEADDYSKFKLEDEIAFGEFGLVRNLPVQKINIYPVRFDAAANQIKILKGMIVRINFAKPVLRTETSKENYLSGVVINFNIAKNWAIAPKKNFSKESSGSVLSEGTWFRFSLEEEGIYKITKDKLADYGLDANTVDPRTIKIYNNGGYILSPTVEKERPTDLVENAIFVSGEDDGKFDDNDYILFYGRGIKFWEFNPDSGGIARNRHWYDNKNYYWITSGGGNGKRMEVQSSLQNPSPVVQTTTDAFIAHEENKYNLMRSGKILVGEDFTSSANSRTFINTLHNIVPGKRLDYVIEFVNFSASKTYLWPPLEITESGTRVYYNPNFPGSDGWYREGWHQRIKGSYDGNLQDNRSNLKIDFKTTTSQVTGYLDFFSIAYRKYLKAVEDEIIFFSDGKSGIVEYQLSNFSNSMIHLYNVSDFSNVKIVEVPDGWISGGEIKFQAEETSETKSKYFALLDSKYLTPPEGAQVQNSNIHGVVEGFENIIITNEKFREQANRLKEYRSSQSPNKVSSEVFYVKDILNEFSCGLLDPTALRDFIKFAYDHWNVKPRYVLLFGDGSYDYFDLEGYHSNFIPTFQTKNSYDELFSYPLDDFYSRISGNDKSADIAVGRLPVNSLEEADVSVQKIIDYENNQLKGLWRNTITSVADDGPAGEGSDDGNRHTKQAEDLDHEFIPAYFNVNKIYLESYPTVITGQGRRKPAVNDAIMNAINSGTLLLNYYGHGNPRVWAHEVVFDREVNIPMLRNSEYFFLTAATCDYGKYDDPQEQSATEEMIFLENRGMIGGFSSSRPVYSLPNAALNETLYSYLLDRSEDDERKAIGTAYFQTKAVRTGRNDEKFHLLCDPCVYLNEPKLAGKIDSLNGAVPNATIKVSAFSNTSVKGSVFKMNGQVDPDFSGEAIFTMFDSERYVYFPEWNNYRIDEQGGVIFRGRVSVTDGHFDANFTVPKDISYENRNGKIVSYFFNEDDDGLAFTSDFIVGGTDTTAQNDGVGPSIDIYFDEFDSGSSYLVNQNFDLLVKLKDDTGLNTTGNGVGHRLEGVLNDDEENAVDLSNYFIGDLDAGGKSGIIDYKFSNLEPGDYTITVKAWDVFNNLSKSSRQFTVVSSDELYIKDVYNYPNPFSSSTYFTLQHNLSEPVNVKIKIYTIAGRLVRQIEEENILDKFVRIFWNGRDEDGSLLANGTYLYKLIVKTSAGGYSKNVLGKIAIIR
ncbi:MAG: type IX secretion system sortase PorU [Chlorobi bacterium]|nr:type IX secretion system sortase PorU [Chlorobiota bacterium]